MQKATTAELKRANTKNVFEFVYRRQKTSKQEIAQTLQLSRPTVTQIVKELMEGGVIARSGHFDSTGGRKADALSFNPLCRVSIGVELLKLSYEIVAVDLYGSVIRSEIHPMPFATGDYYIDRVCGDVNRFVDALPVGRDKVLGANLVLQGLISADGESVSYGRILDCTGLSVRRFSERLGLPCRMVHDGEAAATLELWCSPDIVNAIYFHIRSNLSGALIIDGKFLQGNELKSCVFEHMTIVPHGRSCYCGKRGCMEAYCSLRAFLEPGEAAEDFFACLRRGDDQEARRWNEYLEYLAMSIDNLHMVMDYDVILGGTLGRFLIPEDILRLHRLVADRTAFPSDHKFIRISQSAALPIAAGAALPYIIRYLDF